MWRFDLSTQTWAQFAGGSSWTRDVSGRVGVLAPWGVLAFGGRAPRTPAAGVTGSSRGPLWDVVALDAIDEKWWPVEVENAAPVAPLPHFHRLPEANAGFGSGAAHGVVEPCVACSEARAPSGRGLAGVALLGLSQDAGQAEDRWRRDLATAAPQLFVWGGDDGVSYRSDGFFLDLGKTSAANSLPGRLREYEHLRNLACAWRIAADDFGDGAWATSCGAPASSIGTSSCSLEAVVRMAWPRADTGGHVVSKGFARRSRKATLDRGAPQVARMFMVESTGGSNVREDGCFHRGFEEGNQL
eukprot:scaffold47_cov258-Pinguiococcus_pyrenoidosus.AAC.131